MAHTETLPTAAQLESPTDAEYETSREVASFVTAKGSIYTYDENGRTTRHKTAAPQKGEYPQHATQDITVFVRLTPEGRQLYVDAIHSHCDDPTKNKKVYVVEPLPNGSPRIIRTPHDVKDPHNIFLAALQNDQVIGATRASLEPELGANVFDTRHYQENGQWYTERHLGNEVTEIHYEK